MNDTDLIKAVRELADIHSDRNPAQDERCSLQDDLEALLAKNPPTTEPPPTTGPPRCKCGDLLTITDRGDYCRQCVLQGI